MSDIFALAREALRLRSDATGAGSDPSPYAVDNACPTHPWSRIASSQGGEYKPVADFFADKNSKNDAAFFCYAANHIGELAQAVVDAQDKYFDGHGPLTPSGKHIPERCWKCCDEVRAQLRELEKQSAG